MASGLLKVKESFIGATDDDYVGLFSTEFDRLNPINGLVPSSRANNLAVRRVHKQE